MAIDTSAVGNEAEPFIRTWDSRDALLYAISVGAGQDDAARELQFTTQNTGSLHQRVIPSFVVHLVQAGLGKLLPFGEYKRSALVHAEQSFTLHRELPAEGSVRVSARIAAIADKGSGALVHIETTVEDTATGEHVASTRLGYFVRGEGGFGGVHGRVEQMAWVEPIGEPDRIICVPTRTDQALLYRLNGDFNPLHSDPDVAAAAGFARPILHGLATYGIATRVLMKEYAGENPARVGSVDARFVAPVLPGQSLTLKAWDSQDGAMFQLVNDQGKPVLDKGTLLASSSEYRQVNR